MLLNIAICDDNKEDVQLGLSYLKKYESKQTLPVTFAATVFTSAEALLNSHRIFDLYFLDILMEGMTGIELARELRSTRFSPKDNRSIIFLTSSPDYALPAFSVYASGYLLKPISYDALSDLLDVVIRNLVTQKNASPQCFSFRVANGLCNTPIQDILYVEIMGHTPYFHLTGSTIKGSELRISFGKSIQPLLDTGIFLFPHRSYVVNAVHVSSLSVQELVLDNGSRIPISRNRFSVTKSQYMDFLMGDYNHV